MKNLFSLAIIALFAFAFTTSNVGGVEVDTEKSVITWKGYKVTGQHAGTLNIETGKLGFEDGKLTSGSFVIDMTSIAVTDIKREGGRKKLVGHLASADFFDVAKFPTANFEITKVYSRGMAGDYKIKGELTIKGISKEIKFNAKVAEEEGKQIATADITIDRTDFNVQYGSGSFFNKLGDKTIYDEFDLSIKLVVK